MEKWTGQGGYEFAEDRQGEVYITRTPQPWRIVHIDRLIDEVNREFRVRGQGFLFNPYSCASWEKAHAKHPDLYARRNALMILRDEAVQYRDRMAEKACAAEQRRRRIEFQRESRARYEAMKCPTCGQHTLSLAA